MNNSYNRKTLMISKHLKSFGYLFAFDAKIATHFYFHLAF